MLTNVGVALASRVLQSCPIENGHLAPPIGDQPCPLQHLRGDSDGGALHAQHLGQEVVGE